MEVVDGILVGTLMLILMDVDVTVDVKVVQT